jgi:hypothetical protein
MLQYTQNLFEHDRIRKQAKLILVTNKILSFNKELISRPTKVGPVNVLSLIHIETY